MTSPSDGPRFHRLGDEQRDTITQQLAKLIRIQSEILQVLTATPPEPDNKTVPIARGAAARSRKGKNALP